MILVVGKPIWAKYADLFGRAASYATSILFFTVGTIVIASAQSIQALSVGMVFLSISHTGITLSQQLVLVDLVGTRWSTTISNALAVHFSCGCCERR
ncbi:hypothetical protein BX600DRAFT_467839 [Xylariales sp. PMI_506]|nr:hypothetical protein BX600DRAFT_467839 [Xylariales sp. PMI_506]